MIRIRYTSDASRQLSEILDHIRSRSPTGARNVARRIRQLVDMLRLHPQAGRRSEMPPIRRLAATPYPYLIFYEHRDDLLIVHGVRHAARKPDDAE